ncbi:MAG: 16S rRNA (guanine(527)-N(7))-methyltransferase RsmG [Saprospiraceae bacterium]|nr:16S rRNA (guanine(527)-N(7))-methyltransferase RsmG [Saprospiraceae bacterium]
MELIQKYFPTLEAPTTQRLQHYAELLADWNSRINLISRKDTESIIQNHILHSLSIARLIEFHPFSNVLDLGTGGGLPGIPLAIIFPKTQFHLVDSIGKKIVAVQRMITDLGLENCTAEQCRVEQHQGTYDFVVTRAVAQSVKLVDWTKHLFAHYHEHDLKNGILALKGGDLKEEMKAVKRINKVHHLSKWYEEEFFETKKLVYIRMRK